MAAERLKIVGHGPPGLIPNFLTALVSEMGHELLNEPACGTPTPEQLIEADVVILWIGPHPMQNEEWDEMHFILVVMRESEWEGPKKRIVLISNLMCWGHTPGIGEAWRGDFIEEAGTRKKPIKKDLYDEDSFLKRRGWRGMETQMMLEAHVIRLDGDTLDTVVIGAGAVFGAGEDSFLKLFIDVAKPERPVVIADSGSNRVPTIHVGDLFAFIFCLLDSPAFPKRYLIAANRELTPLADLATAVVDAFENVATAGAYPEEEAVVDSEEAFELRHDLRAFNGEVYEELAEIAWNHPASCMLKLDMSGVSMGNSVYQTTMTQNNIEAFGDFIPNAALVVEEYRLARCLKPIRVWVMRSLTCEDAPALFLSERLKLPRVTMADSLQWFEAQEKKPAFYRAGEEPKEQEEEEEEPKKVDDKKRPSKKEVKKEEEEVVVDVPEVPLTPEEAVLKAAVDLTVSRASAHQKALWALQASFKGELSPEVLTLEPRIGNEVLRLRLLAPDLVHTGYILDAAPADPPQLHHLMLLVPTHVCVVSVLGELETEEEKFAEMERADWRLLEPQEEAVPTVDILDSLRHVLKLEPCLIHAAARRPNGEEQEEAPAVPEEDWRGVLEREVLDLEQLQCRALGSWDVELAGMEEAVEAPAPAPASSEDEEYSEIGAAPGLPGLTPRQRSIIAEDEPPPPPAAMQKAAAYRGQFDDLNPAEFEELQERSSKPREYLMEQLMIPLTKAMLQVVGQPSGTDLVEDLAKRLDAAAAAEEAKAEAAAYLKFVASTAKLADLRNLEAQEDRQKQEAEEARQRGEVLP